MISYHYLSVGKHLIFFLNPELSKILELHEHFKSHNDVKWWITNESVFPCV